MSARWWILNEDGEAVGVTDMHAFFAWERAHSDKRLIGYDQITDHCHVSTVLLASATRSGALPFETLVFGGDFDGHRWRWAHRREAQTGHDAVVAAVANGFNPDPVREETP